MMHRGLFFLLTLFLAFFAKGQGNSLRDQSWNFGDVVFWNNDTAWFSIQNTASTKLVFLPTYYNQDFMVLLEKRTLQPGESSRIGIVFYTEKTGKFTEDVQLFVNQKADPIVFHLKGNIKSMHPNALLQCPVMTGNAADNRPEKVIVVEVRDLKTDEVLIPDGILIRDRDNKKVGLQRSGTEYKMSVVPGAYRVMADKLGYNDYVANITLEPYQQKYIVYMERLDDEEEPPLMLPPEEDKPVVQENIEPDTEGIVEYHPPVEVLIDPVFLDTIPETVPEVHEHPEKDTLPVLPERGELSKTEYAVNNVILIVDVSASMSRGGKIEALRGSFNTLVDALRPEDQITIISMSSAAEVVQPTTGVYEKDSLKSRLGRIKAKGGTNGGAAIQLAYKMAADHFVPGGNNQVIIATDGIFYGGSLTRKQIEALIAQGNTQGIHMSTVAFGSDPKALLFLGNLAQIGGGTAIQVTNIDGANDKLLAMIKSQSKR